MLDEIFAYTVADSFSIGTTVLIIASALVLGLGISLAYIFTHQKEAYTDSFAITLIMLPAIIAMIILLVGSNVARAFSLAGAFSLIRFRSAPGDSKDIAYVFFAVAVGLACGMGYIFYALLFAVILCLVMVFLQKINFGTKKNRPMRLKILLPEDMDYQGLFDAEFREFTSSHKLVKIKTADFGSLFELSYEVMMKDMEDSKMFMDRLRCKNGNLNIILSVIETAEAHTL